MSTAATRSAPRHAVTLGDGTPVALKGACDLWLSIAQHYRIVEAEGERGPYKVSTVGYLYALSNGEEHEILAYHWHPEARSDERRPHLHLGNGAALGHEHVASAHLPTERISLEALLRCAIADLGVTPLRDDWSDVLAESQRRFEAWRTSPSPRYGVAQLEEVEPAGPVWRPGTTSS